MLLFDVRVELSLFLYPAKGWDCSSVVVWLSVVLLHLKCSTKEKQCFVVLFTQNIQLLVLTGAGGFSWFVNVQYI